MSVTVYIWLPNLPNVGHSSMLVEGGGAQTPLYISWWPEGEHNALGLALCTPYTNMSSYSDDRTNEGDGNTPKDADYIMQFPSGLDEGAIRNWWAQTISDSQAQYCLLSSNCSAVVHQALQAGGADNYASGFATWNIVWSPNGILDYTQAVQQGMTSPPIDPYGGNLPPGGILEPLRVFSRC